MNFHRPVFRPGNRWQIVLSALRDDGTRKMRVRGIIRRRIAETRRDDTPVAPRRLCRERQQSRFSTISARLSGDRTERGPPTHPPRPSYRERSIRYNNNNITSVNGGVHERYGEGTVARMSTVRGGKAAKRMERIHARRLCSTPRDVRFVGERREPVITENDYACERLRIRRRPSGNGYPRDIRPSAIRCPTISVTRFA